MGMGALAFSVLTNFYKSFDNGITLVFILSMIPIFLLGMTGISDEAFAQNQTITNATNYVNVTDPTVLGINKTLSDLVNATDTVILTGNTTESTNDNVTDSTVLSINKTSSDLVNATDSLVLTGNTTELTNDNTNMTETIDLDSTKFINNATNPSLAVNPPEVPSGGDESPPTAPTVSQGEPLGSTSIPDRGSQSEFILSVSSLTPSTIDRDSKNKLILSDSKITFLGEIDHEKLKKAKKSSKPDKNIPYLSMDPNYDEMKKNPPKDKSKKSMLKKSPEIIPQLAETQALSLLTGFEGLANNGFIPSDDQVAAGPNHLVQMVNSDYAIFTKQGAFVEGGFLEDFFLTGTAIPFDPKIFYDTYSERWYASVLVVDLDSAVIAISTTNDPTGNWFVYDIFYGDGICPDQPRIGTSNDKFVLSSNLFSNNCTDFAGAHFFVFDKSDLLSGAAISLDQQFGPDDTRFSISPARSLSSTGDLYLVNVLPLADSFVELFTLSGPPASPTLSNNFLSMQASTLPPLAEQPGGTGFLIDTGDMRVQDADFYQGKVLLSFNDSCTPTGDTTPRSCVHLVEINTSTPAITQDIRFGAVGFYYFYPAVSYDQFGGWGVVFGYSSASAFQSVAVTGQPAGSPLGTLDDPIAIRVGSAPNTSTRAGDYSGAATDPTNPSIIWVTGEYFSSGTWSTWIDSINVSDVDNDGIPNFLDNLPFDFNRLCENQTGNWNDANSWFTNVIPSNLERILLVNCTLSIPSTLTVDINNILDVDSTSVINQEGIVNDNSNTVRVSGTYNVQSGGIHNNNAAGFTDIRNGGNFNVQSGGTLNDSGIFFIRQGGTVTVSGQWNEQNIRTAVFGTFNVASGGVYDNGAFTTVNNGGNFNVQAGGTVNDSGIHITQTGGTTTVSGQWNEQSIRNAVFGTFNVASGGVYDNVAFTTVNNGGNFNVQTGGTVNDSGIYTTQTGGTTTVSGQWNEQNVRNAVFGTFNVASGGVYDNAAFTVVNNGGNFNLKSGGKVDNFGRYVTQSGGTTTLDDDYDNNVGSKTINIGTMNLDCNGTFNDLGGAFIGTPIVNICQPPSSETQNNGKDAFLTSGWTGLVNLAPFTNLTPGNTIDSVAINIGNPSGNIRYKVYQDDGVGGNPSTLLGQTNSIPAQAGTIFNSLNSPAIIPPSGTVWVGFETDSSAMSAFFDTGTRKFRLHTFGDGPDPFGSTVGTSSFETWVGIEITG